MGGQDPTPPVLPTFLISETMKLEGKKWIRLESNQLSSFTGASGQSPEKANEKDTPLFQAECLLFFLRKTDVDHFF